MLAKRNGQGLLGVMLLAGVLGGIGAAEPPMATGYWPGKAWRTSSPEEQGISSEVLVQLMDDIEGRAIEVDRILVVRNGYLVLDADFYPFPANSVHDAASVTKSITSLAVGIAVDKGLIKSVQEPFLSFFPDRTPLAADDNKKALQVQHLLTMTSGLCRNLDEGEDQTGRMQMSGDALQFMLDSPLVSTPGSEFIYCSLGPHLLSAILTRATGMSLQTFAQKNLFERLGIQGVLWDADPQGNSHGWGDLFIRPTDLAKIGYLMLNDGRWEGKQVVSKAWVEASKTPHVFESGGTGYGYLWWVPKEPAGLYEGRGRGGQRLAVWPEKNVVVVLMGSGGYTLGGIGATIVKSIVADRPLPANPKAQALLKQKLAEAAKPPKPKPVPPLPEIAARISGKTYSLERNRLGFTTFTLTFGGAGQAVLGLTTQAGKEKVIPVGLDGTYRLSNTSEHGLSAGALAAWEKDRTLDIAFREAAANKNWRFVIRFEGDSVLWTVSEHTGLADDFQIRGNVLHAGGAAKP